MKKVEIFDVLDRFRLHLNAVDWIEDQAPNNMGCALGALRESMENTEKMIEVMLTDQDQDGVPTLQEKTLRQKILTSASA